MAASPSYGSNTRWRRREAALRLLVLPRTADLPSASPSSHLNSRARAAAAPTWHHHHCCCRCRCCCSCCCCSHMPVWRCRTRLFLQLVAGTTTAVAHSRSPCCCCCCCSWERIRPFSTAAPLPDPRSSPSRSPPPAPRPSRVLLVLHTHSTRQPLAFLQQQESHESSRCRVPNEMLETPPGGACSRVELRFTCSCEDVSVDMLVAIGARALSSLLRMRLLRRSPWCLFIQVRLLATTTTPTSSP